MYMYKIKERYMLGFNQFNMVSALNQKVCLGKANLIISKYVYSIMYQIENFKVNL